MEDFTQEEIGLLKSMLERISEKAASIIDREALKGE